jgi:CRP-like cAMP-binding protein
MEHNEFRKIIQSISPFTEDELDEALVHFSPLSLEKGTHFCKSGLISDRVAFVSEGLLRSYFLVDGRETTTFFLLPGSIAVALYSFVKMKPSIESIQAIEDCELLVRPLQLCENEALHREHPGHRGLRAARHQSKGPLRAL